MAYLVRVVDEYGKKHALLAIKSDSLEVRSEWSDGEFNHTTERLFCKIDVVHAQCLMAHFERSTHFPTLLARFTRHDESEVGRNVTD